MGISDAPSGEKSGDFDPNRAAFGKKRPTLRRKRPYLRTSSTARKIDSPPSTSLPMTNWTNWIAQTTSSTDSICPAPGAAQFEPQSEPTHTLNLRRIGGRREQQCGRSFSVVLHFRRHIARW